jgi:predicted DCC family thiol-disulfide oxidoreductase YuxK|tara:strand:- start:512 stop:952 length:441 start_codon:yes stop_codon:yes gene_type:complete
LEKVQVWQLTFQDLFNKIIGMSMIKIFYDGKCGLCSKEINYYIKIAPKNVFDWFDIASNPSNLKHIQVSQHDALMFLHAQDKSLNLKIGVDAFILIWSQLKYWNILAVIVKLPIINQFTKLIYNYFAKYRFNKLSHCQLASCKVIK